MLNFSGEDEILKKWPRDSEGNYEKPMFLLHSDCNDFGDEIIINMLDACGIPCLKYYPGDGSFGKVMLGMSGNGSDLYVPASKIDEAKALCEEDFSNELV